MSFKKTVICVALAVAGFSSLAHAEGEDVVVPVTYDHTTGAINFQGSIVNTPCTITTENENQTVTLGNVKSTSFTALGSKSPDVAFQIKLTNCTVQSTPLTATVTFNGASDEATKASVQVTANGDTSGKALATGVGIQLVNSTKVAQTLGSADLTPVAIDSVEKNLQYYARYISIAPAVTPGLANGHADFSVAYN